MRNESFIISYHTTSFAHTMKFKQPPLRSHHFMAQVETRPLTLVETTLQDGDVVSTLLQNAETVRLVGPAAGAGGGGQVAALPPPAAVESASPVRATSVGLAPRAIATRQFLRSFRSSDGTCGTARHYIPH